MLRLFVKTLGCKVNAIESEHVLDELGGFEIEQVSDEAFAQVAIINTCSVTHEADAKTRKAIRKIASQEQIEDIIVTGCSAAMHPELALIDEKIRIITDKTKVLAALQDKHGLKEGKAQTDKAQKRARSFVKIQDGCENFCSYCIVPFARGANESLPYREVESQVKKQLLEGAHEIVLSGINIGNYSDSNEGISNLKELIQKLLAELPLYRLRISSIEPPDLNDEFIEYFASEPRICKHLHIPLQSGSNKVLEDMERRYSAEDFLAIIQRIRGLIPDCAITTDIIVGFPGESAEDFEDTLELARQAEFSQIHVFKYSKREGTKAADMPGHIDSRVASERSEKLRTLSSELRSAFEHRFKGKEVEVVVESISGNKVRGVSEHYLRYEGIALFFKQQGETFLPSSLCDELIGSIACLLG